MNELLINYSSDPDINFNKLKSGETWNYKLKEKIFKLIEMFDVKWILPEDENRNWKFSLVKSNPNFMYYIWDLSLLNKHIVSIVWPRKHSEYANKVLERLFSIAKKYDIVTMSGLADGVDQLCHSYSIDEKIPTIAVLGTWIWWYLKSKNRNLLEKIVENWWLILSEYKLLSWPTSYSFPQRNRLIAGLADLLFLPEAGEQSGSLITAKFAFEMHKPIYGVPNWIFSSASEGLNKLIGEWKIQMITDFDQMMKKHFKIVNFDDGWKTAEMKWLNEIEIKILNIISEKNWSDLNDLTSDSGLWLNDIMLYLTTLEMQWLVYQESPGIYQRG